MKKGSEHNYINTSDINHVNPAFDNNDGEENYEPVEIRQTSTPKPQNPVPASGSCCGHTTLIKVSLAFNGVLVCAAIAVVVYLLLMSQRMGKLENDVALTKGVTAEFQERMNAENKSAEHLPKGEKGDPGTPGMRGRTGIKGQRGQRGISGLKGDTGELGPKGNDGEKGDKGSQGAGRKGQKGAPGSASLGGAVYARWGRTNCPSTSTLLHSGVIGSSSNGATGGGVDFLCLPKDPQWLSTSTSASWDSWMRSVECETGSYGIISNSVDDKRAVCARCYTETRPADMMIPAHKSCPSGWTREYYGYLMAGAESQAHPTNYICVNSSPSYYSLLNQDNGGRLHFVIADCSGSGSIEECSSGEYVHGRPITCVVCTR